MKKIIAALSLVVVTGWSGQLSLGQMAFAGMGALFAAACQRRGGFKPADASSVKAWEREHGVARSPRWHA